MQHTTTATSKLENQIANLSKKLAEVDETPMDCIQKRKYLRALVQESEAIQKKWIQIEAAKKAVATRTAKLRLQTAQR